MKYLWYLINRHVFIYLPPSWHTNLVFWINCIRLRLPYYWINSEEPKTFTEKLNWLKFHYFDPRYTELADKASVRDFVRRQAGEEYLIPLVAIFSSADELEIDKLEMPLVIKATHGSGMNMFITAEKPSRDQIKSVFGRWLKTNPYYLSREWQYKEIQPRIIVERLLGNNIPDFKLFCFHGKVQFIQVDYDRYISHKRKFFDPKWSVLPVKMVYDSSEVIIPKPEKLLEMIQLAEKLASCMHFVRVDLYVVDTKIYFGELTFFPEGGAGPFDSYQSDLWVGKFLDLGKISQ